MARQTTRSQTARPAYAPCSQCGRLVLTGETLAGVMVPLETDRQSYVPVWHNDTPWPTLHESRGYPTHQCPAVPTGAATRGV